MSAPVDVLAVMDAAAQDANRLRQQLGAVSKRLHDMGLDAGSMLDTLNSIALGQREARAAVAELVAAAHVYYDCYCQDEADGWAGPCEQQEHAKRFRDALIAAGVRKPRITGEGA